MKMIRLNKFVAPLLVVSTLATFAHSQWTQWQRMSGSGMLSMRSAQTNNAGCAFAFRNDSATKTMAGAKLEYIHGGKVDQDILPALRPGESLGGWTAFSVNDSCSNTRVRVYDETWQ